MVETLSQREEAMRKVLLDIQNQRPPEEFSWEEKRLLLECYAAGYFEGVMMEEMITGRITMEYRHQPRITHKGLEFISKTDHGSQGQHESGKPDQSHTAEVDADTGKQSLKWTRAGVVVAVVVGLLSMAVTVLVAVFF